MPLPPTDGYQIIRDFITGPEHHTLLDWANQQFATDKLKANPAGGGRFYASYSPGDDVPDLFWRIHQRAIDAFGVKDFEDEPMFKCFLGCNTEGGYVHNHRDKAPPGKSHARFNIMVSKPLSGGLPRIEGEPLDINERDLWCFFPSHLWHSSYPVIGDRKRFVISIGILVPNETLS